jgi:hypothetical protein
VDLAYIRLNENELDQIKQRLGAALDLFRGRPSTASDIDTLELTKALSCPDLAEAQEFQDFTDGYETASVDFVFPYDGLGDVKVRVSLVNGSVWFRSAVTEAVIDHVFEIVRRVKGLQ